MQAVREENISEWSSSNCSACACNGAWRPWISCYENTRWQGCSPWCCDFILLECVHLTPHWMSGCLWSLMQAVISLQMLYSCMLMSWHQASVLIWWHGRFWVCMWAAHAWHAECTTAGFILMLPLRISPSVCVHEPLLQSRCSILGLQRHCLCSLTILSLHLER